MFIVFSFYSSTGLAIVAEADLLCGNFLSEKSCHKLVVSTSFWSWLLNASSVLTSLKYAVLLFWFFLCVVIMLTVHGSSRVLILVFLFLKYVFFVFILDAIFCGTNFFIFQDSVWLVKKCWWVRCCSNHHFYWVSDRCRSGFVLWWFFVRESCRHKLVVSTSFWSWLLNVFSVLTSMKYTAIFILGC